MGCLNSREDNKYARVRWDFDDGFSVYYSDMRNFGTLKFFSKSDYQKHLNYVYLI